MNTYLAIDIGASSGRHILGWMENGEICTKEVYRFPNGMKEEGGHLIWDIEALTGHVKEGIRLAKEACPDIAALSVDTWGVDYVLLDGDTEILPCYGYRDERTAARIPEVHAIMPFEELYRHTGIQFQSFNTVYQFYDDLKTGRLEKATDYLMIPEYLIYKLCGYKGHEYTNATTMGMVNAETGEIDTEILDKLGLPRRLFTKLIPSGTVVGEYEGIPCVYCASHDTGSAVAGIPLEEEMPFISSGTWSILGVKTPKPLTDAKSYEGNWSNEGGVGYNRYLKNIMGMWLVNELRAQLCPDMPFPEIVKMAEESCFDETVDVFDPIFMAPRDMRAAFDAKLNTQPGAPGDYFRCAYRSIAEGYGIAVRELEENVGRRYDKICIVGGGAKNAFLNDLTARACAKQVVALPIEATAIGNLRVQMKAIEG